MLRRCWHVSVEAGAAITPLLERERSIVMSVSVRIVCLSASILLKPAFKHRHFKRHLHSRRSFFYGGLAIR